ncbi:MAG TPA: DUF4124 domain-containing protein [Cellvibrionaceae bacterium]
MKTRISIVMAALLLVTLPLKAELYRWTDADGKVHFSDRKPDAPDKEMEVEAVEVKPINIDDSREARRALNNVLPKEDRHLQQQQARENQQQAQERARHCRGARQYLRDISGPVNFIDDDGKPVKVSERERQQRQAEMERYVKEHC